MDEEFESLVVTDPDLIDEGIDISGLRTQTDVSPYLLGNIPDYAGIQYEAFNPKRLSELMRLYGSGLPAIDTSQPATPPDTGGGGGGGGGTSPGTGTITPPADSIGGFDPGVVPGDSGFIGLDPEYDVSPFEYDDYGTYEPPASPSTSDPFLASGAAGGARLPTNTDIMVEDFSEPFPDFLGRLGERVSYPGDQSGVIKGAVDPQPVRTILGPDGITYDAVTGQPIYEDLDAQAAATDLALGTQDLVTEQDLADNTSLLQKLGLPEDFDLKQAVLEAGINLAVGVPITLIGKALGAVLPSGIQNTTKVARKTGLLTGDNTVTQDIYGINTQSQFGNYDQYNIKQVDKLENVLNDLKNNKYKDDEQAYLDNTKRLRKELEDRKKYLDAKGLTGVGDVDSGRGSGLRPTADDTSTPFDRDTFDDYVTLTSTSPTRTITPLEDDFESLVEPIKPPMTLADDRLNKMTDDVDLDLFDTTPVDTTVTGTLGPPSEISGPQVTEEKPVDIELADNRAVRELDSDQIIEYENLTNQLEGQEMQKTGNPDISMSKQEEIKNKAIDQIQDQDIIDRGGGDDIGTGGLDPNRGQQVDRGSSGAGDNEPVSTTTGPPSTGFQPQSTYDAELEDDRDVGGGGNDGGGGGNGGGGGKIVCTMMNESYGFGSFRNKIWMKFHKDLSPEYQRGYHKLFLPLVRIAKKNIIVKKVLEHIAVHSTIDMRQSMRGKTHLLGRVYRKILLPLCYWVGRHG